MGPDRLGFKKAVRIVFYHLSTWIWLLILNLGRLFLQDFFLPYRRELKIQKIYFILSMYQDLKQKINQKRRHFNFYSQATKKTD